MVRSRTIYVPVAQFHRGNTSTYVQRALEALGHRSRIISTEEFYSLLRQEPEAYFLCVDSGEPISLEAEVIRDLSLERVAYWLIDFRHHRDGPRSPTDNEICRSLSARGGMVLQSQWEDYEFSRSQGWQKSYYLPLAADPQVWSDFPPEPKRFDLGFAGNVWDRGRAQVLETVLRIPGLKFGFPGHGALWMEEAAKLIRASKIGFNVNSWFGTDHAFDINMRFFETLSCGVPLITNWVPSIARLFPNGAPFLATYKTPEELPGLIAAKLSDPAFLSSGALGRQWIVEAASYSHRVQAAIELWDSSLPR